jgi:hypothetical protein
MPEFHFLRYDPDSAEFFDNELGSFLESRNVSQLALDYIRRHIIAIGTSHSTNDFELKQFLEDKIRGSPYLMSLIIRLYYYDYKAFNLPLPEISNLKEE